VALFVAIQTKAVSVPIRYAKAVFALNFCNCVSSTSVYLHRQSLSRIPIPPSTSAPQIREQEECLKIQPYMCEQRSCTPPLYPETVMRGRHCTADIPQTLHGLRDRVSEDLGSGHQEDVCDPGCTQAHRYFYARTDARSGGPGRRAVDLKVDLHPRLRLCSFDACLGIPESQLEVVCYCSWK
jgi:hypothetical protein